MQWEPRRECLGGFAPGVPAVSIFQQERRVEAKKKQGSQASTTWLRGKPGEGPTAQVSFISTSNSLSHLPLLSIPTATPLGQISHLQH